MLIWWHDYFAPQNQIYLFWALDVNLAAWLLCPPKSHLLILQVEQVDVILTGKDIAVIFWCKIRCTEFLRKTMFWIPNFGIGIPIWWLFNSGILKTIPTRISGIRNGIGILLTMGVPEIGTKNWNSQPSLDGCSEWYVSVVFLAGQVLGNW